MVNAFYHVEFAFDLTDQMTDDEISELRWHLGLGSRPPSSVAIEQGLALPFTHGGAYFESDEDLFAALARRRDGDGWRLTARQEADDEELWSLCSFLDWLRSWIEPSVRNADGSIPVGRLRFYDEQEWTALGLDRDGLRWEIPLPLDQLRPARTARTWWRFW
ncbi:hypothetical protein ACWIGI_26920 [Nocardia sp. NPDC055321]